MIRVVGCLGQINKKSKHNKWFPVQYFLNDMASLYEVVIYGGMVWVAYGQKKKKKKKKVTFVSCVDSWKIIQLCNFNIPMCNATYWLFFILFILFLQFYLFMSHFTHLLGPEQVSTCEGPIAFWITIFCPKWSHFSLPEHAPKLTKLGIYITPAKKLFLSYISTTRWRYDQGKCVLVCNFNIVYSTFKNLISTPSLNCVESCHIGGAHFRLSFFFFKKIRFAVEKNLSVLQQSCLSRVWICNKSAPNPSEKAEIRMMCRPHVPDIDWYTYNILYI